MIEKIKQELESFSYQSLNTLATIGTTTRKSADFAVLPRRKVSGFEAINFLVSTNQAAEECLRLLDGNVKYILIDVEAKKNIDLELIARSTIKSAVIIPYKPNDATVEAADLFLLNYFNYSLRGKKILIYGAGNIGGKLAFRLAERGAKIYVYSRDINKVELIVKAFNTILPKYSINKILPVENIYDFNNFFDGLISFISAENIINHNIIYSLKENALIVDGGINNFSAEFYKNSSQKLLNCFRLDVRLGFLYTLLPLMDYSNTFFMDIQGTAFIEDIKIVSGGIIGEDGDIIVDNIKSPNQVIGVANGIGGKKEAGVYTGNDLQNLNKIQKYILANQ